MKGELLEMPGAMPWRNESRHTVDWERSQESAPRPHQSACQRRRGRGRCRRRSNASFTAFGLTLFCMATLGTCAAQSTSTSASSTPASSAAQAPARTTPVVDAMATPYLLTSGSSVISSLPINSDRGLTFQLAALPDRTSYLSLQLCAGPSVAPYNVSDTDLLRSLGESASSAQRLTLPRVFTSRDAATTQPGPDSGAAQSWVLGGAATFEIAQGQEDAGAWISLWPPEDTRGATQGNWTVLAQAGDEGNAAPFRLAHSYGLSLADTDRARALVTSSNMSLPMPDLNITILPSTGPNSIDPYFNSSLCAVQTAADAWAAGSGPGSLVQLNATNTQRGVLRDQKMAGQERRQWDISGLEAASNYTVWLSAQDATLNNATIWPAIKFATKSADNCRLVYDVPFCPNVAYAIPIGPEISTTDALTTINATVSPNLSNFTQLLGTFPCGDPYFGPYSGVKDCGDCLEAYQDWLCAVAMPRCVDALDDPNVQSAAAQNSTILTGGPMPANTDLLPYVVNRRDGRNESRQGYIDDQLSPGTYGELLPCIYTCYFVSRSCPAPLVQWSCPKWGISAQRSYGAFADSGPQGIGASENGGAGNDLARWGGPTRYIAQDAFGNAYCNAMGVDVRLSEDNGALPAISGLSAWRFALLASATLLCLMVT